MFKVPGDVIVFLEAPGHWIANNVFTHTSLGMDEKALMFMGAIGEQPLENLVASISDVKAKIWEIEYFSNYQGLLTDPTRYLRGIDTWPKPIRVNGKQLSEALKKHWLIIDDENAYKESFGLKGSLLDKNNRGNFHQQLGQELLLMRREDPSKWWVKQKFSEDFKSLRSNLYLAIQGAFLEKFFAQKIKPGLKIVDIGCGIGFYANMMARFGADVLGVDPNESYIQIARQNSVFRAKFSVNDIGKPGALDFIPSNSIDIVFISDALLFYFVSPTPQPAGDIQILFQDIRRILKSNGYFYSMEPSYIFWLAPWLGDIEHPFTILTEYLDRNFLVTPPYSKLIKAFKQGGFVITDMEELQPDVSFKEVDPRAYHFANQFPLWQMFELKKVE